MVLGVDPFNARQLATDVSMSSSFGFLGFAQAAVLRSISGKRGLGGLTLFGANVVGLVGYELGQDYLQNRIRNGVASDPKRYGEIWNSSLPMETATNLHRCIPPSTHAKVAAFTSLGVEIQIPPVEQLLEPPTHAGSFRVSRTIWPRSSSRRK